MKIAVLTIQNELSKHKMNKSKTSVSWSGIMKQMYNCSDLHFRSYIVYHSPLQPSKQLQNLHGLQ